MIELEPRCRDPSASLAVARESDLFLLTIAKPSTTLVFKMNETMSYYFCYNPDLDSLRGVTNKRLAKNARHYRQILKAEGIEVPEGSKVKKQYCSCHEHPEAPSYHHVGCNKYKPQNSMIAVFNKKVAADLRAKYGSR
jgi:hypothetical protein